MKLLLLFICSLFGVCVPLQSSGQSNLVYDTRPFTRFIDDRLYWTQSDMETAVYYMNRCPLDYFEGYKKAIPVPISVTDLRGGYIHPDKNYFGEWAVIDSMLYLCDIHIDAFLNADRKREKEDEEVYLPDNKKYRLIEALTGTTFQTLKGKNGKDKPLKPQGVIPADWFTGTILLKEQTKEDIFDTWLTTPFVEVTFRNGKVVHVRKVNYPA